MAGGDDIKGVQFTVTAGTSRPQSGRHDPSQLDGKQRHARFNYDEHDVPNFKVSPASAAQRLQVFVKCSISLDRLEDPEPD